MLNKFLNYFPIGKSCNIFADFGKKQVISNHHIYIVLYVISAILAINIMDYFGSSELNL